MTKYADRVYTNGEIYTVNNKQPWAGAVATIGGDIVYVGDNDQVRPFIGDNTIVTDLEGKMMLPGFHDTHIHLLSGGMQENKCTLNELNSVELVLEHINKYIQESKLSANEWVHCSGLNMTLSAHLTIEQLDQVSGGRPLYMLTCDGHSMWVNSRVLELAGIHEDTPDPLPGKILRHPGTKTPTGFLYEYATQMVKDIIPVASMVERVSGLETGMNIANQFGITSVLEPGLDDYLLAPYIKLHDENKLKLRIRASISPINWQPGAFDDGIVDFVETRNQFSRENINVESVKMYIDGVLENGSAVLLEPYLKEEYNGHLPFYPQDELDSYITWLDNKGLQVHIHAIGDGGVRMALNAFEAAQKVNGKNDNRHTICHLQMIDPQDIPRFGELGVYASFQALWAQPDEWVIGLNVPILGEERLKKFYLINSVHKTGGVICGGSDWFVSSLNPLEAMATAVRRQDPFSSEDAPSLNPEETVDIETMIAAYTINAAHLMHQESRTGSIEINKKADLIILDQNICKIPATEIHKTKVIKTVFDGQLIYDSESGL